MSGDEKRAGAALASVFALRMLGLFLILPVFAIHAQGIPGGDDLMLVGIALGAYGLTQAMFQIPFGMASDAFGRKRVIVFGLLLFAAGSAVAALATDIWWTIGGRILQGAGAISAAVTALAADLTREQHRTKVMAMIGSSIGLMFAISLVAAPALYGAIGMSGIFWLTAVFAIAAIGLVTHVTPPAPPLPHGPKPPFREVLLDTQLLRLNFGIFTLHMVQMAMFVVVPGLLDPLWRTASGIALENLSAGGAGLVCSDGAGDHRRREVQQGPAGVRFRHRLAARHLAGDVVGSTRFMVVAGGLLSFFVAFNILEAMLPSLISRIAPARAKGAALGVYNTTQALGLFVGGALGGWLLKNHDAGAVFLFDAVMVALWLVVAATMMPVPLRRNGNDSAPRAWHT